MGKRIMTKISKSNIKTNYEFYNEESKKRKKFDRNKMTEEQLDKEILTVKEFIEERLRRNDWVHEHLSEGQMACAVTSTGVDTQLKDRKKSLSAMEMFKYIFSEVKKLQLQTKVTFSGKKGNLSLSNFYFYYY